MSTGKVILLTVVVSALTSAATYFGLRAVSTGNVLSRSGGEVVPPLTGLSPDQARKLLEPKGLMLIVTERREDPKVEPGRISIQTPLEGSKVKKGAEVRVVVSKGQTQVQVPGLARMPLAGAMQTLASGGFKMGTTTRQPSDQVPKDHVIATVPPAGQSVAKGATVNLVVSDGAAGVEVPKVLLRGVGQAKKLITSAGFTVGKIRYSLDEDRREGAVLQQNPAAGTKALKGSAVDLVVNQDY